MRESTIQNVVRLALSKLGFTAWRNNTGAAWQGKIKRVDANKVFIENARLVSFGLTRGSSDVVGFKSVKITPEFLGRTIAVFTAVEVKRPGEEPTEEQRNFLNCVRDAGGIAVVACKERDVEDGLRAWESLKL